MSKQCRADSSEVIGAGTLGYTVTQRYSYSEVRLLRGTVTRGTVTRGTVTWRYSYLVAQLLGGTVTQSSYLVVQYLRDTVTQSQRYSYS